jgi:hypothetical protein
MSSRRELILQNIETTLNTISVENGYEVTLLRVARVPSSPFDNALFPCVMILDQGEDKEEGIPVNKTTCTLKIEIVFWNDEYVDMSTKAIQIQSSIEKAMKVDNLRGGYAYDTKVISNSFLVEEEHFPLGGGTIMYEIYYRHALGDPYSG